MSSRFICSPLWLSRLSHCAQTGQGETRAPAYSVAGRPECHALVALCCCGLMPCPQKSRLPEPWWPVRFRAPSSLSHEVGAWLAETDQLLQVLLWGPDLPPGAWLTTALLISGTVISLWHAFSRRLALYFLTSLVLPMARQGAGFFVYSHTLHRNVVYALPLAVLLISAECSLLRQGAIVVI